MSSKYVAFPGGWKFFPAAPASIAANKLGQLVLESTTIAEAGVYATWIVQP